MNPKTLSVLIIDDHPMIVNGYRNAFERIDEQDKNLKFMVKDAQNCDDALSAVRMHAKSGQKLDLILLDIRIPASTDGKLLSGEDLGVEIKEQLPDAKIVVSTTLTDNFRIHNILKNIDPDGFLTKNDLTPESLMAAIKAIINNPPYYSSTVLKQMRTEVTNDFVLDNIDRKLLYELSIGTMVKDLPEILHLSIAAIEKRKRHLKQIFNAESSGDKELLLAVKEKGFL